MPNDELRNHVSASPRGWLCRGFQAAGVLADTRYYPSMIVGYARVSTTDQIPQLQIDALKAAKCKPIYVEQKSGKNMNRPELTRCLDTLRKGDTLVIWKLDRLGRSLRDLLEIAERLENSGVQFISLTEDINTKAASGRLIFHIFAVLAE